MVQDYSEIAIERSDIPLHQNNPIVASVKCLARRECFAKLHII